MGGLLILNGFITIMGADFDDYLESLYDYILTAIDKNEDDSCVRVACGLVSDIANNLEKNVAKYLPTLMQCLNTVLISNNYRSETKAKAIIAVGDICLASEDQFSRYI
jgi:hypothetical protein